MTREEVILRGELAAILLSDATLKSFFDELMADLLQAIGHTEPEDTDARSSLYYRHRGVRDVLAHMSTYVEMAHAAREADEQEQKDLKNGEDVFEMQDYETEE